MASTEGDSGLREAANDQRPPPRLRWISITALAAVAAIGTFVALTRGDGADDRRGNAPPMTLAGVEAGEPVSLDAPTSVAAESIAAGASPRLAVEAFLRAEVAGDHEASFGHLDANTRSIFGDAEVWASDAGDRPVYRSYRVVSESLDDGEVVVDATWEPELNESDGVIAGQARVTFATVEEQDGWRIDLETTVAEPQYPDASLADAVAVAWAAERQACDEASSYEYDGSLLGSLGVREGLCGSGGEPKVVDSGGIDRLPDPSPLISAFGDSAPDWARIVTVGGLTTDVDVVLAPYGDDWRVVGALAV